MKRKRAWVIWSVTVCSLLFLTSCAAVRYPTVDMLEPARLSLGAAKSIYVEPFTAADSGVPDSLVQDTHQAYIDILKRHNPLDEADSLRFVQSGDNADILVSGIVWCDYRADSANESKYNSSYKTESKVTAWHKDSKGRKIGPATEETFIVRVPGDLTAASTLILGLRVYERDTGNIRFGTVRVEIPKANIRKQAGGTLPSSLELQRPLANSLARQAGALISDTQGPEPISLKKVTDSNLKNMVLSSNWTGLKQSLLNKVPPDFSSLTPESYQPFLNPDGSRSETLNPLEGRNMQQDAVYIYLLGVCEEAMVSDKSSYREILEKYYIPAFGLDSTSPDIGHRIGRIENKIYDWGFTDGYDQPPSAGSQKKDDTIKTKYAVPPKGIDPSTVTSISTLKVGDVEITMSGNMASSIEASNMIEQVKSHVYWLLSRRQVYVLVDDVLYATTAPSEFDSLSSYVSGRTSDNVKLSTQFGEHVGQEPPSATLDVTVDLQINREDGSEERRVELKTWGSQLVGDEWKSKKTQTYKTVTASYPFRRQITKINGIAMALRDSDGKTIHKFSSSPSTREDNFGGTSESKDRIPTVLGAVTDLIYQDIAKMLLEIVPSQSEAKPLELDRAGDAHAIALMYGGAFNRAVEVLDELIDERELQAADLRDRNGKAIAELAASLAAGGKPASAIEEAKEASYAKNVELADRLEAQGSYDYYNRGICYECRGEYVMALEDFKQANELTPTPNALYTNAIKRMTSILEMQH